MKDLFLALVNITILGVAIGWVVYIAVSIASPAFDNIETECIPMRNEAQMYNGYDAVKEQI